MWARNSAPADPIRPAERTLEIRLSLAGVYRSVPSADVPRVKAFKQQGIGAVCPIAKSLELDVASVYQAFTLLAFM